MDKIFHKEVSIQVGQTNLGGELYIRDDGKARMEQSEDPTELILGVRSEIE